LCGADTWTLWKVDRKYLENCEIWCWKWMEVGWPDRVKIKYCIEPRSKGESCMPTIARKTNWIFDILGRNCLLNYCVEGRMEGARRRERRREKLLNALKETRSYLLLKKEALFRTLWSTCFGRGCGPFV